MRSRGRGGVISDTGIGHAVTVLASRLAIAFDNASRPSGSISSQPDLFMREFSLRHGSVAWPWPWRLLLNSIKDLCQAM
jgi:hypothetical protein